MDKVIRVFIDQMPIRTVHSVRGIGTYTRELIKALEKNKKAELVSSKDKADIIHYPYFDLFFNTLRVGADERVAVTVFDTIPLIYPKQYPAGVRGRINLFLQKQQLKKVRAIVTISETSKKDIVRFLDVPQEKIFPIHLAPSNSLKKLPANSTTLRRVVEKYRLPEKFVLYVGDVNYNKNIPGLIQAVSILGRQNNLVLVGKAFKEDIKETRQVLQLIRELGLKDRVVMPGFVPEEGLVAIYNLASVCCQPSFYEGFGLPVLEAMACGVPVVAAKTQALVEIAEGKALFADARKPKDLAGALIKVLSDMGLHGKLSRIGLEHAKKFSWDKVADETIKVYSKVVHS